MVEVVLGDCLVREHAFQVGSDPGFHAVLSIQLVEFVVVDEDDRHADAQLAAAVVVAAMCGAGGPDQDVAGVQLGIHQLLAGNAVGLEVDALEHRVGEVELVGEDRAVVGVIEHPTVVVPRRGQGDPEGLRTFVALLP